jgi:hypothetical protein
MNKSVRTFIPSLSFAAVTGVSNSSTKPHNPKRNDRHAGKVDKAGRKTVPVPGPATTLVMAWAWALR